MFACCLVNIYWGYLKIWCKPFRPALVAFIPSWMYQFIHLLNVPLHPPLSIHSILNVPVHPSPECPASSEVYLSEVMYVKGSDSWGFKSGLLPVMAWSKERLARSVVIILAKCIVPKEVMKVSVLTISWLSAEGDQNPTSIIKASAASSMLSISSSISWSIPSCSAMYWLIRISNPQENRSLNLFFESSRSSLICLLD